MSGIISALLGGGLLTAIISFLTLWLNYKRLFAETVSTNRMDWINAWRENVSKFISCAKILHFYSKNDSSIKQVEFSSLKNVKLNSVNFSSEETIKNFDDLTDKLIDYEKEYYEAKTMITSRLNLSEEKHKLLFATILNFDYSQENQNFTVQCELIEELVREILKLEWERVKTEAKGKYKKRGE